jgi:thiamine-phosphate pyrophosphorylase
MVKPGFPRYEQGETKEKAHVMTKIEQPQIYLITPSEIELAEFAPLLAALLDAHPVACVRLALSSRDKSQITRAADGLRKITHARDVALVIENHVLLVETLGLDGVHLSDGSRSGRATRKTLGAEAIVGAFCGTTRHDGIGAAEAGADYASFGPIGPSPLGDGGVADFEIFQWWSEMIEVPVVAEGNLSVDLVRNLSPFTDFFAFQDELWQQDDPVKSLTDYIAAFA